MKKTLLLLAIVACGSAQAEWTAVSGSLSGNGYVVYVDRDSIRRDGSTVRFWAMQDFAGEVKTFEDAQYRSSRMRMVVDCRDETFRREYIGFMEGRKGEGKTVSDTKGGLSTEMRVIPPDTANWFMMREACRNG